MALMDFIKIYYGFKKISTKEIIYRLKELPSPFKKAGMTWKKNCSSSLENT